MAAIDLYDLTGQTLTGEELVGRFIELYGGKWIWGEKRKVIIYQGPEQAITNIVTQLTKDYVQVRLFEGEETE